MITLIEWHPNVGSPVTLNDLTYPLSAFEPESALDVKNFKKMQAHGEWPSFTYLGAMTVVAEGRILGVGASDALRSADYVAKRLALVDAILPATTTPLTARSHGFLRIQLDGMTEVADANAVVTSFRAPIAALFPANSEFFVNWKMWEPWFVGASTTKYQIG